MDAPVLLFCKDNTTIPEKWPIYTAAALTKAHGKCMENGRENMHTDVRVKRVKQEQDLKA